MLTDKILSLGLSKNFYLQHSVARSLDPKVGKANFYCKHGLKDSGSVRDLHRQVKMQTNTVGTTSGEQPRKRLNITKIRPSY